VSSNPSRAAILVRALRASVDHDRHALDELYTDDVKTWTPATSTGSLEDLITEFDQRDAAFSDVELELAPLDVGGDYACVEWTVTMTHTGPLELENETIVDATGVSIVLYGVTVAEFEGEKICALRQYWDELSVFEQLGLIQPDP
jgi:ketosteroid isomerase-like protein